MDYQVLGPRKCGDPKEGGFYLGGQLSPLGTFKTCTVIAYPHAAEAPSALSPTMVAAESLNQSGGLFLPVATSQKYKNLGPIVLADLWGKQAGYQDAWDAIMETRDIGPNRKVSKHVAMQLSDKLPIAVLMMHSEAIINVPDWDRTSDWLGENFTSWKGRTDRPAPGAAVTYEPVDVLDQPWRNVPSLGRRGDPEFFDHPYALALAMLRTLRKERKLSKFKRECKVSLEPGVMGLTWFMELLYVISPDQDDVPDEIKALCPGVVPAVTYKDPRANWTGEVLEDDDEPEDIEVESD